jgi:hypothetical protein
MADLREILGNLLLAIHTRRCCSVASMLRVVGSGIAPQHASESLTTPALSLRIPIPMHLRESVCRARPSQFRSKELVSQCLPSHIAPEPWLECADQSTPASVGLPRRPLLYPTLHDPWHSEESSQVVLLALLSVTTYPAVLP